MSIQARIVRPLFSGFIVGGFEGISAEIRHVLVAIIGGALRPNLVNIEYAIWLATQLGSLGAPALKGNNGTTNALGEFVVNATAFSPGDEVLIITREAAGAAGGVDDIVGIGFDTVSPV